jgi:uncharacterized protein (TIGR03437 family)
MKRMIVAVALWPAFLLSGQTAQTIVLRAAMSGASGDSGAADVLLHLVTDSSGAILSGSVDLQVAYQFPNDTTVTGLGITNSVAGTIALATGITAASPILATAGSGRISRQIEVPAGDRAGLAVLNGLLHDPGPYGVVVISQDQPAGAITGALTGALTNAQTTVLMALLNSSAGTGVATISITYTGAANAIASAEVSMQLTYQFSAQVTFSSLRIYAGQGQGGAEAVAADLMPGTKSAAGGTGVLSVPATQVSMTDTAMVQAVQKILSGPTNFSVDVGAVENPSAPLTGPLRVTDSMTFPVPGFAGAGAASQISLHTLRTASGSVAAGTVLFDVNYRLAAGAQISGVNIDGSIIAPAVSTDPSGSGNAYTVIGVDDAAGLAVLNGLVADPAAHRLEVVAASTISAPLASASAALPVVAAVIPIVEVKDLSTFAPGELVEIYGSNLAPVTTGLGSWPGGSLPTILNGVSVTLGGQTGRILYVSPGQVDAAFAFETPTGSQVLTLTNANGTSAAVSLNVKAVAPALYNFAFENVGFSMVNQANPASGGDTLVFYLTGMGQTTTPLATGQSIPLGPPYFNTPTVTVTIGGANAPVIYSIAAPPYVAGLYQMAVTVPAGLLPGNQAVVATSGGMPSNTVTIVTK